METAQVKKIIADQFANPQCALDLQNLLQIVAERAKVVPTPADLARGSSFIYNYIEQVPYLLTVAWTSARNVGIEIEVKSILQMVESYWIEDDDVIPDSIGIFGIMDDAYCSLSSMQSISDLYRMQTGKHLFPDDLTAANAIMRKIIGEPYTTELDKIVSEAVSEAGVEEAIKLLATPEKQRLLDSEATIWNHGPVGELSVSQLRGLGLIEDS
jgi:hypothetical protein